MKRKSIPSNIHILKYGFLFGVASIIFSLTSYLTGNYSDQGLFHLIILFFITVVSIILGQLMFKKRNGGYINLGEALKIAIGISLIGGLIALLWKIMLIKVIDPEIVMQFEDKQIKRIAETSNDLTQEKIERTLAMNKKFSSLGRMILMTIIENTSNGIIFGLIGGLIIQKKRDPFK